MNEVGNLEGWQQRTPAVRYDGMLKADEYRRVYLGLGSNIAPESNLVRGVSFLRQYMLVLSLSHVWETAPVPPIGPNYLNAAALVKTHLPPALFKSIILRRIEVQLGRMRTSNKNAPRTLDLDILIYDEQLVDMKVWTHAFVAVPLAELIPDYTNPATGETLRQVADRLAKASLIKLRPEIVLSL